MTSPDYAVERDSPRQGGRPPSSRRATLSRRLFIREQTTRETPIPSTRPTLVTAAQATHFRPVQTSRVSRVKMAVMNIGRSLAEHRDRARLARRAHRRTGRRDDSPNRDRVHDTRALTTLVAREKVAKNATRASGHRDGDSTGRDRRRSQISRYDRPCARRFSFPDGRSASDRHSSTCDTHFLTGEQREKRGADAIRRRVDAKWRQATEVVHKCNHMTPSPGRSCDRSLSRA